MAHQPVPLILSEQPIDRRFSRGAAIRPGTVLVLATADGQAVTYNHRPTLTDGLAARYRTQYTVDVTDHLSTLQENLPSRDDVFAFEVTIDIGWRVTDPRQVVLRRVSDGLAVARSHLVELMRSISRRFDQEEPARAERAFNDRLRARRLTLPEGITIFRASVRVSREKRIQGWAQEQILQEHEHQRRINRHQGETAQAHHENAMANIAQQGQLRREQERYVAVRAALGGQDELLLRHLTMHPEDTAFALQSIAASRQADRETQLAVIDRLLSTGMLQPADAEGILARFAGLDVRPAIQPPPYGHSGQAALPGGSPAALPAGPRPQVPVGGLEPSPAASGSTVPTEASTGSPAPVDPSNVGAWRPVGKPAAEPADRPVDPLAIEEEEHPIVSPFASHQPGTAAPAAPAADGADGANVAGWRRLGETGD